MSISTTTAELLDDVGAFIQRYVVMSAEQSTAVTLWVLHTHVVDAIGITPYLAITSAEKGSGKTQLLEVLELLVARPWLTGSVTAATLARKIHAQRPTLLLDESDAAFNADREYAETLRGVLNSGFKASGTYSRCVGTNGANLNVEDFATFCPKAIAGIGRLPDTVADRSIPITLKRKAPDETVERKRERKVAEAAAPIRERLEAWALDVDERLSGLDLAPLDELPDRAADIWEPLLGIAYIAGETWFSRARKAAITLSGRDVVDDDSIGVQLLVDLREIWEATTRDEIPTAELVAALNELEESPWGEWKKGRGLTARSLAMMLKPYGIVPVNNGTVRVYRAKAFLDPFRRYLPPGDSRQSRGGRGR